MGLSPGRQTEPSHSTVEWLRKAYPFSALKLHVSLLSIQPVYNVLIYRIISDINIRNSKKS